MGYVGETENRVLRGQLLKSWRASAMEGIPLLRSRASDDAEGKALGPCRVELREPWEVEWEDL